MNKTSIATMAFGDFDQIGLVKYAPHSGDPSRAVAAVWRRERRIQWSSLCLSNEQHVFNSEPFSSDTGIPNTIIAAQ
jgi:hypothetical protein